MKKIIATGLTGFIGGHCIDLLLKRGYEVHAISRSVSDRVCDKGVIWYEISLFDLDKVSKIFNEVRPHYFLHLAWKMETGLNLNSENNKKWSSLSISLLDCFYKNGGQRALVVGSCFEYDHSKGVTCETLTPLEPNNEYGKEKNKVFKYLKNLNKRDGVSYAWARVYFTFGPGQNPNSLIPYVIANLKNNKTVETTDGHQKYDYLYVKDVASALIETLKSSHIGPVNISSGETIKLKDLILKIAKKSQKEHLIHFGKKDRPVGSPDKVLGLNKVLKNETNWKRKYSIDEGLTNTINYYNLEHGS